MPFEFSPVTDRTLLPFAGEGSVMVPHGYYNRGTWFEISGVFEDGFRFGDQTFTGLRVSTNGEIQFGNGQGWSNRVINAFQDDHDSRLAPEGVTNHGIFVETDTERDSVLITWNAIGQSWLNASTPNTLQVELRDRGDQNAEIIFRFADMQQGSWWSNSYIWNGVRYFNAPLGVVRPDVSVWDEIEGNTGVAGVWQFRLENGVPVAADFALPRTNLTGTDGDDLLDAGFFGGVLLGLDGNDTLRGGALGDAIAGDAGDDVIYGDSGSDYITGGDGHDMVFGGDGNDLIGVGEGDDTVEGGNGNDTIYGGAGDDELRGDGGNDFIHGGDGDDLIRGGSGSDTLAGGAGNDTIYAGSGRDQAFGGAGDDLIVAHEDDYNSNFFAGMDGNDTLTGSWGNDTLLGGIGDDLLRGRDGADLIAGGDGNDTILGADNNIYTGSSWRSQNDTLYGGAGDDFVYGGFGNDLITGDEGDDHLVGGAGDDILIGGVGDDFLFGALGADTMTGGPGADRFFISFFRGDSGNVITDYNAHEGDALVLDGTYFNRDNLRLVGDRSFNLDGSPAEFASLSLVRIGEVGGTAQTIAIFDNASQIDRLIIRLPTPEGGQVIDLMLI